MSDFGDRDPQHETQEASSPERLKSRYPDLNGLDEADDEHKLGVFSQVLNDLRGRLDQRDQ